MPGRPSRLASLAPQDDGRASNHAARIPTESSKVDGVSLEVAKLDELKCGLMRGGEDDAGRASGLERLTPARGAETPAVAGLKAGKAELRPRRGKVVAPRFREGEELRRHLDAHRVQAQILGAGMAAARAIEPGDRALGADRERLAEDVPLRTRLLPYALLHEVIVPQMPSEVKRYCGFRSGRGTESDGEAGPTVDAG